MASFIKKKVDILWLIIIFLFVDLFITSSLASPLVFGNKLHRSIQQPKGGEHKQPSKLQKDLKVLYYSQTLDHFNYQPESYIKFNQKYMIYDKHWGGPKSNSPILAYLGDEQPLFNSEIDANIVPDYAAQLKALLVFIEHRFYGESIPLGMSFEEALRNTSIRGYFNSAQAITDYAELILHLKQRFNAHYSPVIVVGGSYGGMLASWFRLKYPHIALGALASSAPVLYFDNIISPNHGYYSVVTKDFQETSERCYQSIKKSWAVIEKMGSKPHGLSHLSKRFKTCAKLKNTEELTGLLESIYSSVAQYENAELVCKAICKGNNSSSSRIGSEEDDDDLLNRIYAGVVAYFRNNNQQCYDTNYFSTGQTSVGYAWQTCSEMVMPVAYGRSKHSMFPPQSFNMTGFIQTCKKQYNVVPRPHWITTYYGGHDMKLILKNFGSNIIFSNGLRDPYSSAGVLEDLSDSIIALPTKNGTHCMDIYAATDNDPKWLINQRKTEVDVIKGWIHTYYLELQHYLN